MSSQSESSQLDQGQLEVIVKELIQEPTLVKRWVVFCKELGVTDPCVPQWEFQCNCGNLRPYELFMKILTSWLSEKGDAATKYTLRQTLNNVDKVLDIESLEMEFCSSISSKKSQRWPIWFKVGQLNRHFVGRERELNQLYESYVNPDDKLTLISGLGGIGKTELMKKFASDLHKNGNVNCTLFQGETEESLNQSLISLAKEIGIETEDAQGKTHKTLQLFEELVAKVSSNELCLSWLVIFDNVDDLHPDLLTCLELLNETEDTFTILTSRNRSITQEDWKLIELDEWKTEDAIEFVKRSLGIDTTEEDDLIVELCDKLQNHALAMQQAVAYITQQRRNRIKGKFYSLSDYINEFDTGGRKTSQLLDHELSKTSHKFAKTTFVTWDITLAKIKETQGEVGRLACFVLDRIAYLDPTGIQFEFLAPCLEAVKESIPSFSLQAKMKRLFKRPTKHTAKLSEEMIECAVELLKAYCLVKVENKVIFIHRLVQEVTRLKLNSTGAEFPLLKSLIQGIEKCQPFSRSELAHLLSVWKYSSKHENLFRKYPIVPLIIFNRLYNFGLISETFHFATSNYTRFEEVLGEDHLLTLGMKHSLAISLDEIGEWEKSLEIYKEVWEKKKEILGEEHKDTLAIAHNLANVLYRLNRLAEAKELLEKVWESQKKSLGENHPSTMTTKHNLAVLLSDKGEVDLALGMFNELLEWEKEKLGERHLRTLLTRYNIADCCLLRQGKYLEAKEILEVVCELSKAELGEEHPDTIDIMHSLGETLSKLPGQEEKALQLLQQVLTLLKKIRGVNHPYTMNMKHSLAVLLKDKGEVEVALGMYNEVLEWQKEKLGERHRDTLAIRNNIAYGCLLAQGKYLEAKEILEVVCELSKAELGEEHPDTIGCMHSLGETLSKLPGQEENALQLLQQVLTLLNKIHGVNYPLTLETEQLVKELEGIIGSR